MPELPEAELWRGPLAARLSGRRVTGFTATRPGFVRAPLRDPRGFADGAAGRDVTDVERRGKRLLLRLADDKAVTLSMGLWARLELRPDPLEPLQGAQFEFGAARDAGPAAGALFLAITEIALANVTLGDYRPPAQPPPFDALDPRLGGVRLASLAASRAAVKAFLMDDRCLLGVGNGYSDELLWAARVHPRRPCGSLQAAEWAAVAQALRAVLTAACEAGGESGFVGPDGRVGSYERVVHHHGGEPCPRCGSPLGSIMAGRRETNFCPVCQPA